MIISLAPLFYFLINPLMKVFSPPLHGNHYHQGFHGPLFSQFWYAIFILFKLLADRQVELPFKYSLFNCKQYFSLCLIEYIHLFFKSNFTRHSFSIWFAVSYFPISKGLPLTSVFGLILFIYVSSLCDFMLPHGCKYYDYKCIALVSPLKFYAACSVFHLHVLSHVRIYRSKIKCLNHDLSTKCSLF